jgi:hypothetical protein
MIPVVLRGLRLRPPGGLTVPKHSTTDPVTAALQMVRIEILASTYASSPEASWMIMNRLEIACLEAGLPDEADRAHARARESVRRCGFVDKERWERSPRWFRILTRRHRDLVELYWTETRYRRIAAVIDGHLAPPAAGRECLA